MMSSLDVLKGDKDIGLLAQSLKVSEIQRVFEKRSSGMLQKWQVVIPVMAIPEDLTHKLKLFLIENGLSVSEKDRSTLVVSESFSRTISFGVKGSGKDNLQKLIDGMVSAFSIDVPAPKPGGHVIDASR